MTDSDAGNNDFEQPDYEVMMAKSEAELRMATVLADLDKIRPLTEVDRVRSAIYSALGIDGATVSPANVTFFHGLGHLSYPEMVNIFALEYLLKQRLQLSTEET